MATLLMKHTWSIDVFLSILRLTNQFQPYNEKSENCWNVYKVYNQHQKTKTFYFIECGYAFLFYFHSAQLREDGFMPLPRSLVNTTWSEFELCNTDTILSTDNCYTTLKSIIEQIIIIRPMNRCGHRVAAQLSTRLVPFICLG